MERNDNKIKTLTNHLQEIKLNYRYSVLARVSSDTLGHWEIKFSSIGQITSLQFSSEGWTHATLPQWRLITSLTSTGLLKLGNISPREVNRSQQDSLNVGFPDHNHDATELSSKQLWDGRCWGDSLVPQCPLIECREKLRNKLKGGWTVIAEMNF